jgi:superfamily II DNA or RNA helicase
VSYADFLHTKRSRDLQAGFEPTEDLLPGLFPFQRQIVELALRRGRMALFADCGLGKTPMQLAWAREIPGDVLIVAPLAVSAQTQREGEKFGVPVTVCKEASDVRPGVNITNYERLGKFDPEPFTGLVLDESSILKGFDGKTRKALNEFGAGIDFRLCCTATPAPNDLTELTNHAEFLGVMSGKEVIALFFTQDGNVSHSFRLKGHARKDFWAWMASWSVALRQPSDLGFEDEAFVLPALNIEQVVVGAEASEQHLFPIEAQTLKERQDARRSSIAERVDAIAAKVNESDEAWLLWCNLNAESEALAQAIPDAVEVRGSHSADFKERALLDFSAGKTRVMVSKPSIAGFGMNWQHCHNVAFVGLSDSYEQFYQAVRRCWRFGQEQEVNCHIVTAETEGAVVSNIKRKERQSAEMMGEIVKHMNQTKGAKRMPKAHEGTAEGDGWTMHNGDSVELVERVADESVGLTLFSPPFPSMYAYTDSERDMGNVKNMDEMIDQFGYLIPGLLRVTLPGRHCAIHLTQGVAQKGRDGYIGLRDFRGKVIEAMESEGWVYYGEVCIEKDPQVKAIRTKDRGLLFKTLANDSAHMHMAMADYLLQFRKPGENQHPIRAGISEKYENQDGWITPEEWIEWASPVWYRQREGIPGGIRETNVLNVSQARETDDERHLCPLQLDVIERAVKLWTNPDELVFSPFAGIGSEGVGALRLGRRFEGIELKRSYYDQACRNLAGQRVQLSMMAGAA